MSTRKNTKISRAIFILLIFLTNVLLPHQASLNVIIEPAHSESNMPVDSIDKNARAHILESYGSLPLSFESNQGQSAAQVKFLARGSGYNIFLTEDETVITLPPSGQADPTMGNKMQDATDNLLQKDLPVIPAKKGVVSQKNLPEKRGVLRMKLVGANRSSQIRGVDPLEFKSNYFAGKDPSAWRTGISNFAKVQYEQVYDGVDMVFYGQQQQLEYDFQVAAGINPAKIIMALEGAKRLRIDAKGDLVLTVGDKEIRQKKPVAFQEINGGKQNVAAHYVHKGKNRLGFQLGRYDKSKPLIIDPILVYSTFLGGERSDIGSAITVDANGCAYVTGITNSSEFPLVNSVSGPPLSFYDRAIFVSKLNPTGTGLLYSSTIKNLNSQDVIADIKVNSSGQAYVVGKTSSENFPTVNSIQPLSGGFVDAFVLKLSQTGSAIIYSTYLGGMDIDEANGVAVDGNDNAIIVGSTSSTNFPLANPMQSALNRVKDAFVTKLNPTGSAFVYSTYLGGSTTDVANDVATDAAGNAYIVGTTQSGDFPLMNPVQSAITEQTMLKSTNGGASWVPLTNGLPAATSVYDIEIDPTNPATLYLAGSINDVYKSTNGGANWVATNVPRMDFSAINEIEIAPSNPATLYAGTDFNRMVRSTNGGANWSTINGSYADKNSIAVSPATAANVYLANRIVGFQSSTDSGDTFDSLDDRFPNLNPLCVAISPSTPDVLYLGTIQRGLWKYSNSSFQQTSLRDFSIILIVVDPSNPNIVYASSASGISKSTDGGTTWVNISAGLLDLNLAETLAIDPSNSSILYAGTRNSLVYKSLNGGMTWFKLLEHPTAGMIKKIEIDPNSPNTVYVGAAVGGDAFVTKINPTGSALIFSSYFGGKGNDAGLRIGIDPSGNPIIAGGTLSDDLSTTAQQYKGKGDIFVTKFNLANYALAYSSYIGGSESDSVTDMAVDNSGNIYVTGNTFSTNFPITADALPLPNNGACLSPSCFRAYLTKLNANGSGYIYSTYFGGSGGDNARGIAVDLANNAYVTGYTSSTDFPTTPNAFDRALADIQGLDAFIIKVTEGTPFLGCLKDDANGNVLRINTAIGEFEFVNCRKGWSVKGPLTAAIRGCKIELTGGGRTGVRLSALINTCIKQGSATITVDGKSYSIADPGITGNECNCSTP